MKPLMHFHITITGPDGLGHTPEERALVLRVRDSIAQSLPEVLKDELEWLTVASVLEYTVKDSLEGDYHD